jgi:translation initiation factor IF-2
VRPDVKARERAAREGVDVRFYSVIYNAIDDIENSLKGMLKPEFEEVQSGLAEIREVFRSSKAGNIAGCHRAIGNDHPQREGAGHPRRRRGGRQPRDRHRCAASRTTSPKCARTSKAGIGLGKFNDIQIGDEIETIEYEEKLRA